MKKLLIILLLILCVVNVQGRIKFMEDNTFHFNNVNFSFNGDKNFSSVSLKWNYLKLNTTIFDIDPANEMNVTLNHLNETITGTLNWTVLVNFTVNTSSGKSFFNISGFENNKNYTVNESSNWFVNVTADGSGYVRFNATDFSADRVFTIAPRADVSIPSAEVYYQYISSSAPYILSMGMVCIPFYLLWSRRKYAEE